MLLTHYLRIGWRNLIKHRTESIINIFGLAVGLAVVILIMLIIQQELSYDRKWSKADRLYRVHSTLNIPGRQLIKIPYTPASVKAALDQEFPEIEASAHILPRDVTLRRGQDSWSQKIFIADPAIIKLFDLEVVAGNLPAALEDRQSLVLNESLAFKYFGEDNPLGQTMQLFGPGGKEELKVAAIIRDLPNNTHLQLAAFRGLLDEPEKNWGDTSAFTYFLLKPGENIERMSNRLSTLADRYAPGSPVPGIAEASDSIQFSAMSIKSLRSFVAVVDGVAMDERVISPALLWGFSAAAGLILAIACINTMNLGMARIQSRTREISLRKALGAKRQQLIFQFLGESVLLTTLSLIVAVALAEILLPLFSNLTGSPLNLSYNLSFLAQLSALILLIGITSGIFPALILSSSAPANKLKASYNVENSSSLRFRSVLIVIQFSAAIGLLATTGIVFSQVKFLQSEELGLNPNHVLVIRQLNNPAVVERQEMVLEELRRHPQIIKISRSSFAFDRFLMSATRTESMPKTSNLAMGAYLVDYDFFTVYQVPFLAGGPFLHKDDSLDASQSAYMSASSKTAGIIINESGAHALGIPVNETALGTVIMQDTEDGHADSYELIGIIADAHFFLPIEKIGPEKFYLQTNPKHLNSIHLRYGGNTESLLEHVKALWQRVAPEVPLEYLLMQEHYAARYQPESNQGKLFSIFAALTILIACLGLYAIANMTITRRTKEIGVRKALGAKVTDIVRLMLWQFSKPVLLANLVAWPLAYYFMSDWLDGFAYRIGKEQILLFCIAAGTLALLIAWATVASNALRAARARPVKALRYE